MKIPSSIKIHSRTIGLDMVDVRPLGKQSNTVFYESIYIDDLIRKKLLEDRTKKIEKMIKRQRKICAEKN